MTQALLTEYDARVTLGKLRPDGAQRAALALFAPLTAWLNHPAPKPGLLGRLRGAPPPMPPGLYLWGGVGRGKSMLMDLFVAQCDPKQAERIHFHAFMQRVQADLHAVRARGQADAALPVADAIADRVRLLALDEMQITDITDAMIVGRLFERLMARGVGIVTTSNRAPDDLYKDGLNRALFLPFIALIKDRMQVHELLSEQDYRQNRLSGAQVWFTDRSVASRAALDAIWNDLTGHDPGQPLHLIVKSRRVTLPRFHAGVARAGFWDLCGAALGPADYLAVADACRVLILDDIPYLGASNYNEAKRFVTLIDTLYEARVRLIASAAAQPEMLYPEGTGAFEFQRTASRLREMQAADWAGQ